MYRSFILSEYSRTRRISSAFTKLAVVAAMLLLAAGAVQAVVIDTVKKSARGVGYDAEADDFGDMVKKGIIDPTKVVRSAIQGAASVAGLLITTEAMVAEIPQKKSAGGMPGGGMGGMGGGMDF